MGKNNHANFELAEHGPYVPSKLCRFDAFLQLTSFRSVLTGPAWLTQSLTAPSGCCSDQATTHETLHQPRRSGGNSRLDRLAWPPSASRITPASSVATVPSLLCHLSFLSNSDRHTHNCLVAGTRRCKQRCPARSAGTDAPVVAGVHLLHDVPQHAGLRRRGTVLLAGGQRGLDGFSGRDAEGRRGGGDRPVRGGGEGAGAGEEGEGKEGGQLHRRAGAVEVSVSEGDFREK